tara:strand:+ start:53 stop:181 length:129 start_codon:yes stop_codon:yes gene_type:complete
MKIPIQGEGYFQCCEYPTIKDERLIYPFTANGGVSPTDERFC